MSRFARVLCAAAAVLLLSGGSGCGRRTENTETAADRPAAGAPSPAPAADNRPVIVAFGDSLTAGRGVLPEDNYPAQLQRKLDEEGYGYRVVNAGISGETSAQGLNRLAGVLSLAPAITIVELGANDGLRGIPVEVTRANLSEIVRRLVAAKSDVILAGMEMPPNYGPAYTSAFREIFPDLATEHGAALIPFFLDGVGGIAALNQDDGIHPTAQGYEIVVENVWRALKPLLRK